MCDRAGFFGENPHRAKMVKNGPKTWFFGLLGNRDISFVWNLYKMEVFMVHQHSVKTACWEKSGSQVKAKNGSWLMRFQYYLIVNISLID